MSTTENYRDPFAVARSEHDPVLILAAEYRELAKRLGELDQSITDRTEQMTPEQLRAERARYDELDKETQEAWERMVQTPATTAAGVLYQFQSLDIDPGDAAIVAIIAGIRALAERAGEPRAMMETGSGAARPRLLIPIGFGSGSGIWRFFDIRRQQVRFTSATKPRLHSSSQIWRQDNCFVSSSSTAARLKSSWVTGSAAGCVGLGATAGVT